MAHNLNKVSQDTESEITRSHKARRIFFFIVLLVVGLALSARLFAQDVDDIVHGPSDRLIHFGVLVKNDTYTIYRSAALGKTGLRHLAKILRREDLPFPKTIIYMNDAGYQFPLYFAVHEYEASLDGKYGDFEFFHPFGKPRTYVDGQNPYEPTDIIDTDMILGRKARRYFQLGDGEVVGGVDAVLSILNLILDPERQPVLFHCLGGIHRTGMLAMLVRFLQAGFWVDGPKTEAWGRELNPAEYEYFKFNPIIFRPNNIKFVEEFSKDERFLELQEKYKAALNEESQNIYFGNKIDPTDKDEGVISFAGMDD